MAHGLAAVVQARGETGGRAVMQLRPYQLAVIDELRARLASGKRRIVLNCPTGGGKTVVAAELIRAAVAKGTRVVFLAHRKELIDQTIDKLARFGVQAGVVMASDRRRDDWQPVQVCSTPTLARRMDRLPPAGLLIYDEVHHAASQTSRKIIDAYPDAAVIGLTATPWRSDRLGLADIFEDSVLAATVAELMEQGSLVRYDAFAYDSPDLHAVRTTAGDFNQKDLEIACNTSVLVGGIVKEWLEHAKGRRTIVFPVSCQHSRTLVDEFLSFGVAAAHVEAGTPKAERERILRGLDTGEITVVSSVGVLTEGFDSPRAEVCVLARPTKSLSLFLQMCGRVLRPAEGKTKALIHDHSGNFLRHGALEEERDYTLTATPKRVKDLHTCPECKVFFAALACDRFCPSCWALIQAPECQMCHLEQAPRSLVVPRRHECHADAFCECGPLGMTREPKSVVSGQRIDLEQIRARRAAAGIGRELSDKELTKVASATRKEMAAEYLRLCVIAQQKGFKPGFVAHEYRKVFGVWPRFSDAELETAEPAREPFVKLPPKSLPQPHKVIDAAVRILKAVAAR